MATDQELAQWRTQRMAQRQGGGASGQGVPSAEQVEQQRRKQQ